MTDRWGATRREAEVLALLGGRFTNAEIAARLHLSVRTVENHVSALLRKCGVADRRALAELAAQVEAGTPDPGRITGVPAALTSFVGRDTDRRALLAALETARLVTVQGPGGVGKTRLAAVLASAAGPRFPAGGAFVDLVPVRDGYVAQAVAAALDVSEGPHRTLDDAFAGRLGDGRFLLILDNCEHVADAAAAFAERLLAACPGARVLATSRERLGVPGERVVRLAPLPLGADAEALFLARATAADPDFAADAADVAAICARLDGLPLAIELAAARGTALGAGGLLAALDDTLRVLAGGRGADRRHRSLRTVLGWSHDLLDDEERRMFRRLAVFAGSFDLGAAVAATAAGSPGTVADVLGRLADKSLIVRQPGRPERWRMLETVRAFARDRLMAEGEAEREGSRQRHLAWAVRRAGELVDRVEREDREPPADEATADSWREDFDRVADDLRAALDGCPVGPGRTLPDPAAHSLARALGRLAFVRRFLEESLAHYKDAAARAPSPAEASADLREAAGCAVLVYFSGDEAFELYLAAAEQSGLAGDADLRAAILARGVEVAARYPGFRGAAVPREELRALLAEARAAGDPADPVVAASLANAEVWSAATVRLQLDAELAAAAEQASRATGDPLLISAALDAVRTAATAAGRLRDAFRASTGRLALLPAMDRSRPRAAEEIEDTFGMVSTDAVAVGDLRAALWFADAVRDDDLAGAHPYLYASKVIPGFALAGHHDRVPPLAARMWQAWERAGRPDAGWMSTALSATALTYGLLGDDPAYRLWRERAAQVAGTDGTYRYRHAAFAAFVDARVAVHSGDVSHAQEIVAHAFGDLAGCWFQTYALAAAAELAVVAGHEDAAARLASAAPAGVENRWAAACLARAKGRLLSDPAALAASAEAWEQAGARFEASVTDDLLRRHP
ncbi:ATP-binding protein [Catenulispora subtropica]|uniref:HTH luxR-type domain-containing protein n=1 Tax=Catenulispora subtropica TaxID=450798 RepID=A0ABP5EKZ5_9ACTN